jgi:hypothetical protein
MPLNTYIGMSNKDVIKLAEKIISKYTLNKLADNDSETRRIIQTIVSRFPQHINQLKSNRVAVTLKLDYDSGIFTGGKIAIQEIIWSSNTPEDFKTSFKTSLDQMVAFLNTEGMKFEDGPWHVTLPPLK